MPYCISSETYRLALWLTISSQTNRTIPTILKRFRQSVLYSACSGKLTADWREQHPDLEFAEVLFNNFRATKDYQKINIKNELPIPFDLPSSWEWINLVEGCESITDGDHQPPPKRDQVLERFY